MPARSLVPPTPDELVVSVIECGDGRRAAREQADVVPFPMTDLEWLRSGHHGTRVFPEAWTPGRPEPVPSATPA